MYKGIFVKQKKYSQAIIIIMQLDWTREGDFRGLQSPGFQGE